MIKAKYRIIRDKFGYGVQKKFFFWWTEVIVDFLCGNPIRFDKLENAQRKLKEIIDKENFGPVFTIEEFDKDGELINQERKWIL